MDWSEFPKSTFYHQEPRKENEMSTTPDKTETAKLTPKGKPQECKTCWYSCDVKNISECPLILKAKEGNVDTKT